MRKPYRPRALAALTLLAVVASGTVTLVGLPRVARGQTQGEMNQAAGKDYRKADAELNAAYKKLLAVLDGPKKARLKKAQAAWLTFRDAEAAFLSSKVRGGSVYPSVLAARLASLTRDRTQALKDARKLFTTDGEM